MVMKWNMGGKPEILKSMKDVLWKLAVKAKRVIELQMYPILIF